MTRERILEIFAPDMCRSIYMTYAEDAEVFGISGYKFTAPKQIFEDARIYPDNECYCTHPGKNLEGCTKSGAFHLGPCRKGNRSPKFGQQLRL